MLENMSCICHFLWQSKAVSKSVVHMVCSSNRGGHSASCRKDTESQEQNRHCSVRLGRSRGGTEPQASVLPSSEGGFYGAEDCGADPLGNLNEVEFWFLKHMLQLYRWDGSSQCCLKPVFIKREPPRNLNLVSSLKEEPTSLNAREQTRLETFKNTAAQMPFLGIQTRRSSLGNHGLTVFQVIVIQAWSLSENQISNQVGIRLKCVQSQTFHSFTYK